MFLEGYLDSPYLVAPEATIALETSVDKLNSSIPGFECVVNVHHGSWSPAFSDFILQQYYPEKIAIFELSETPNEALAALSEE